MSFLRIALILGFIGTVLSFTCKSDLYQSSCQGYNTGQSCYYMYYFDQSDSTCKPRTKLDENCISYKNLYGDDGVCQFCNEGYVIIQDARNGGNSVSCTQGSKTLGCKFGHRYREDRSMWLLCYSCDQDYFPVKYTLITALKDSNLFDQCQLWNKAVEINNCMYMGMTGKGTYKCHHCKTGFILKNDGSDCIEYDGDSRCIKSGENDTGCSECWWPYWFHGSLCSHGNILARNIKGLLITFLLVNFTLLVL